MIICQTRGVHRCGRSDVRLAAGLERGKRGFGLARGGSNFIQFARNRGIAVVIVALLLCDIGLADGVDRGLKAAAFFAHHAAGARRGGRDPDHCDGHEDRQHGHQKA